MGERTLVVHEHQRLVVGSGPRSPRPDDIQIDRPQWDALAAYVERSGSTALRIGHNSLTVRHHVGYLQVGRARLEILPKLHRDKEGDWRGLLVHMLREVLSVRLTVQTASPLQSRFGRLYSALVDRFLELVEGLLREGLARVYREVEGNETHLRGRLVLARHLRENVTRRNRLYVAHEVFDADALVNRMLHQALVHVRTSSIDGSQKQRAEGLLAAFPSVGPERVVPADFQRLRFDRRTTRYREAIELARLLLLSERPDLRWAGAPVLSMLFDMNALFEAYVARQLRKLDGIRVRAQAQKVFWRAMAGSRLMAKPDLVLSNRDGQPTLVIDTKWKVPHRDRPSPDDLRQLFAYLRTFGVGRGILLYPRAHDHQQDSAGDYVDDALAGGLAFIDVLPGGQPNALDVRQQLRDITTTRGSQVLAR